MAAPGQPRSAVEVRDLGIGQLQADAAALKAERVTVGYQGPEGQAKHPHADASVAQVAAWMEFGTPGSDERVYDQTGKRVPSRPFVREALTRYRAEIAAEIKRALQDLLHGRVTKDQAQARVGAFLVEKVREVILDARSWATPLADSTIAAKGHDDPLIESGAMYDAASWAVRDAAGKIVRQGDSG